MALLTSYSLKSLSLPTEEPSVAYCNGCCRGDSFSPNGLGMVVTTWTPLSNVGHLYFPNFSHADLNSRAVSPRFPGLA